MVGNSRILASWVPKHGSPIEIPGQYDQYHAIVGAAEPRPELHARLVRFDDELLAMKSIRKPVRVTMWANDENEYKYLVKHGEDLRQDARIEQLFAVMNGLWSRDAACVRRNLSIRTYAVVPMSTDMGVLGWVDDTKPLKAVLEDAAGISSKDEDLSDLGKGLKQLCKRPKKIDKKIDTEKHMSLQVGQMNASSKCTAAKTRDFMDQLTSQMPRDLLRRHLLSMGPDAECFLALRQHFARSYAAMCVSNYVCGIGDRHLENTLLDTRDGSVVGIDFGMAFGMGTRLSVPELIPFRLTPQFLAVFTPLDTEGLLKRCMVEAMRVLHEKRSVVLNTMDVFAKDPLLDWRLRAEARNTTLAGKYEASSTSVASASAARASSRRGSRRGSAVLSAVAEDVSVRETVAGESYVSTQ
jgi:DNA-dependent protein kinase catalytic subunit